MEDRRKDGHKTEETPGVPQKKQKDLSLQELKILKSEHRLSLTLLAPIERTFPNSALGAMDGRKILTIICPLPELIKYMKCN